MCSCFLSRYVSCYVTSDGCCLCHVSDSSVPQSLLSLPCWFHNFINLRGVSQCRRYVHYYAVLYIDYAMQCGVVCAFDDSADFPN